MDEKHEDAAAGSIDFYNTIKKKRSRTCTINEYTLFHLIYIYTLGKKRTSDKKDFGYGDHVMLIKWSNEIKKNLKITVNNKERELPKEGWWRLLRIRFNPLDLDDIVGDITFCWKSWDEIDSETQTLTINYDNIKWTYIDVKGKLGINEQKYYKHEYFTIYSEYIDINSPSSVRGEQKEYKTCFTNHEIIDAYLYDFERPTGHDNCKWQRGFKTISNNDVMKSIPTGQQYYCDGQDKDIMVINNETVRQSMVFCGSVQDQGIEATEIGLKSQTANFKKNRRKIITIII